MGRPGPLPDQHNPYCSIDDELPRASHPPAGSQFSASHSRPVLSVPLGTVPVVGSDWFRGLNSVLQSIKVVGRDVAYPTIGMERAWQPPPFTHPMPTANIPQLVLIKISKHRQSKSIKTLIILKWKFLGSNSWKRKFIDLIDNTS